MAIDLLFLIAMVGALIRGLRQGLILGIFSLLAYVVGLAAALKLSAVVAQHLQTSSGSGAKWLPVLSFVAVFILVALLVNLAGRILQKTASLAMLGWVDKLGGAVFYGLIYCLIFSVLLFFAEKTFLIKPETVGASSVHAFIAPWGPMVIENLGKIIPVFKDLFMQLQVFFENLGHKFAASR